VRRFLAVGKECGLGLGLGEGWMILVIHELFSAPTRANHRGAAANANSKGDQLHETTVRRLEDALRLCDPDCSERTGHCQVIMRCHVAYALGPVVGGRARPPVSADTHLTYACNIPGQCYQVWS
jgi:hypothetical protein